MPSYNKVTLIGNVTCNSSVHAVGRLRIRGPSDQLARLGLQRRKRTMIPYRFDAMKEKPIILPGGAPMIRAVLEGRKSQFRVPFSKRTVELMKAAIQVGEVSDFLHNGIQENDTSYLLQFCPFGAPGQRLWVRETWNNFLPWSGVYYAADDHSFGIGDGDDPEHIEPHDLKWRSPMHMPRWASRITLEIVNVRVQRLQEIIRKEIADEGIELFEPVSVLSEQTEAKDRYREFWESIHGSGSWDANPFVWVREFRRV